MESRKIHTNSPKGYEVESEYQLNLGDYVEKVKFFILSLPEYYQRRKRELLLITLLLPLLFVVTFIHSVRESSPDNLSLYKIKRAQEKLILGYKTSPHSRADYYEELLDNRLKELNYLGKNNLEQHIAMASSRYSTTLGELSELIIKNNLDTQRKRMVDKLPEYRKEIRKVHDMLFLKYSVIDTLNQRWHLQAAMDSSDIFREKLLKSSK